MNEGRNAYLARIYQFFGTNCFTDITILIINDDSTVQTSQKNNNPQTNK